MHIKLEKSKKEIEQYKIQSDPISLMTEQELDVYIDQVDTLEELKELVRKIAKLARCNHGNS